MAVDAEPTVTEQLQRPSASFDDQLLCVVVVEIQGGGVERLGPPGQFALLEDIASLVSWRTSPRWSGR
jgi:hypothetical protein